MNKYCTKCGNPLNEGDHFCAKCGTEYKDESYIVASKNTRSKNQFSMLAQFKKLPIWMKCSYIFASIVCILLIIYSLVHSYNYDYYISNEDIMGYVCCYDDLHLVEEYNVVHYDHVENIGNTIEHAKYEAKYSLDRIFQDVIIQSVFMIFCFIIIHILILIFKRTQILNKYKLWLYGFIFCSNIFFPLLILFNTSHSFYPRSYAEKVSRTFLSDISAIKEHATEYGLSIDGRFKGIEHLNNVGSQNNQSSNSSSSNNTRTQEDGSFVYYEEVQEIPQGSNHTYYEDNTNNDRQSEYQEPCSLCGGDGKCFSIRANTSAAMEMYCNGSGVCNHCNGKGYVNNSYLGVDSPMKCTYCNGTGSCQSCHGTGVCKSCHGRGH